MQPQDRDAALKSAHTPKSKDKGLKLGIFIWAQLRERLSQRLVDEWVAFPIFVVDTKNTFYTHNCIN